jgi:hypothetical protein
MLFAFLQLALLALGLTAAFVLFLSVKREMDVQARMNRVRWDDVTTQLSVAESAPKPPSTDFHPAMTALSGMNQNTRIQAVRLLRRGEDVAHIAAAFGIARNEVELLVRVHQLSTRRASAHSNTRSSTLDASYSTSSLTSAVRTTDTILTISAPKNAAPNPST